MKLKMIFAAVLAAGTAMADVEPIKFNGNMAMSWSSLSGGRSGANLSHISNANDAAFAFDQGRFGLTGGTDTVKFAARANYAPKTQDGDGNATLGLDVASVSYKKEACTYTFGRLDNTIGFESSTFGKNPTYSMGFVSKKLVDSKKTDGVRYSHDFSGTVLTATLGNRIVDNTNVDDNKEQAGELAVSGKAMDSLKWYLGFANGNNGGTTATPIETTHTFVNAWLWYTLNEDMDLGLEYGSYTKKVDGDTVSANNGSHNANGFSLYATYKVGINTIALRAESITDKDNMLTHAWSTTAPSARGTYAKTITSVTLADKIKLDDNLSVYAEYRMDGSDEKSYLDNKAKEQKSASVITAGLVASF